MDWSKVPDVAAIGLLAWAFASASRRNHNRVYGLWLTGWLLIVLHFLAFMFLQLPGALGTIALIVGLVSLSWAGILFMWASVPYREERSSLQILIALMVANLIYLCAIAFSGPKWLLNTAAILIGTGPLTVALASLRQFNHLLRWVTVGIFVALGAFLLVVQGDAGVDPSIGINGVLFTIFFGCCLHFWYMYRRSTAGAYITICGFLAWAAVFVVSPLQLAYLPNLQIESEVWNLPKYVVAVGMILLLLEEQIEHNKHLALHDSLTGLPNRRLFQDRLESALERARRTKTNAALIVLDLDRFKQVNDTLGHHIGDLLLQQVANIFAARVRRSDTVARTGGDEFSVILESPANRAEANHVGRSLQELLRQPLQLDGRMVKIAVSLGIAMFPEDASDQESLCIEADLRMYDNKRAVSSRGDARVSAN